MFLLSFHETKWLRIDLFFIPNLYFKYNILLEIDLDTFLWL